ncbi:YlbF family regulator [Veillonella sp. 3310]|uniref:YlbF family regulator n=1 Tax=Veillonella sp. 3310 TaxID=2490956 RepID=UPI000FD65BF6|nr:YlbF family regulator [Veillonella sp. 3310]
MNYDLAYELQKAMRDSEEHKEMMAAQEAIKDDQAAKGMVEEFMSLQMQLEYAKIADAPEAEDLLKKLEGLLPMVQANFGANAYLTAHARWTQVANDIYRIISEPITEGMKILEKAQ